MSKTKLAIPGRWPWEFAGRHRLDSHINAKHIIIGADGTKLKTVYLGPAPDSVRLPAHRFRHRPTPTLPINASVRVYRGKRLVGRFVVANYRPDKREILLVHEKDLPCVD